MTRARSANRARFALCCAGLAAPLAALAGDSRAESARAEGAERERAPEVAAAVATEEKGEPLFVGRSGQIYEPAGGENPRGSEGGPRFSRRAPGGVAAEVQGAAKTSGGLFAVGARTPLYRREDGVWYTHELPDRGRAALSRGGREIALGVGALIYEVSGDEWERAARAPGEIEAVWAGRGDRYYAATEGGELHVGSGRSFREIESPLDEDDAIRALLGRPGETLYAFSEGGELLRVGSRSASEIAGPSDADLEAAEAFGYLADGTPALVARGADDGGHAPRLLLALRGDAAGVEAELPAIDADDRAVAIAEYRGETAVATREGALFIRGEGGWRKGEIRSEIEEGPKPPQRAPAPARAPR